MIRVLVVEDEPLIAEAHREYIRRMDGFEVIAVAHTGRDAVRTVASAARSEAPVDLVLLSEGAPPTQLGLFLSAFAELPRARPIPIVLAGASRPAWAHPEHSQCSRPYREQELLTAVRATLGLAGERGRAEDSSERVPLEAIMLP